MIMELLEDILVIIFFCFLFGAAAVGLLLLAKFIIIKKLQGNPPFQ